MDGNDLHAVEDAIVILLSGNEAGAIRRIYDRYAEF